MGQCLGEGVHGSVYELLDEPNKVVKLAITYSDAKENAKTKLDNISKVYKFIIDNPNDALVNVFDFKQLYEGKYDIFEWEQEYIAYSAFMEKLNKISDDEQKIFKTICDAYNKVIKVDRPIKDLLGELSGWLEFDKDKILTFYEALHNLKIDHKDVEVRNVMKNSEGIYKLIDFDLVSMKEEYDGTKGR